jgi:salicylate hydroxylase
MPDVVIVGGGIGGLTAAACLTQAGLHVQVLEQAHQFGEVGAGVQLGPNATRVLRRLGLGDALREAGFHPGAVRLMRWEDSTPLSEQPLAAAAEREFGSPYYTLYRPDLIALLATELPPSVVRLGTTVIGIDTTDDGRVAVKLADGSAEAADVVIGADGTHSTIRAATVGDVAARFSGMAAYRALVPHHRVQSSETAVVRNWLGPHQHLVAYPVGRDARYINLVCVVPEPSWTTEAWNIPGSVTDLRRHFDGWSAELTTLLDAVEEPVFKWALYDREPLARWSTATTTLLGDACHPMLPFLAQGAAQAIEDAAALARCLSDTPADIPAALARYEAARRPHTAKIQRMSWDNNTFYHLPDGPQQAARDEALQGAATESGLATLRWIYGNDPEVIAE